MASFNKAIIVGNLCKDPDIRDVGSSQVAHLRIAVNESYTNKDGEKIEKAVFVDVEAWDKTAQLCAKYLTRGSAALVEGKLQMYEWVDEASGGKRSKLKIRANRVEFLSHKDKAEGAAQEPADCNEASKPADGEDIPF